MYPTGRNDLRLAASKQLADGENERIAPFPQHPPDAAQVPAATPA
jgi:hypothetical protein